MIINKSIILTLLVFVGSINAQTQSQSQSQSQNQQSQSQSQSQTSGQGQSQNQSQSESYSESEPNRSKSWSRSQNQSQRQGPQPTNTGNMSGGKEGPGKPVGPKLDGGFEERISYLSQQISREMAENQKTTIAVVGFSDIKGRVTDFGLFLAEELVTHLYRTKKFRVIERKLLDQIIAEQKLSLTGIIDSSSAKRLGRILGVDAIVSGTITNMSGSLKINARLISTESGEIFAVASTDIVKDQSVAALMSGGGNSADQNIQADYVNDNSARMIIDAKGITFELRQCKRSGGAIICEFSLTSNERERELWLSTYESTGPSSLFDDAGNEATVAQVRLGSKVGEQVNSALVAGVATRASFRFEGISTRANKIALLKINGFITGGPRTEVEFRDIPVSR